MDCPSHDDVTHDLFLFPLGDATHVSWSCIGFPFLHTGTVSSFASLYSITRSRGAVDVCLVSVSTLVISRELSQLKGERSF
jgi:hypothetical protein